ncbi:histidine kinase [Streptomyces sp. NPDC041068]|uniref:sensor histidine kinase n=1 Tax=Streptomyces sp. NPDC041068 TaxID=3155130 RepID=UPI0033DF1177
MPAIPSSALSRYATPGAWAAASWCVGMASAARAYTGAPLMPTAAEESPTGWDWLIVVAAAGVALYGGRLLGRRPLTSLGLLIVASYTSTLAIGETGIAFLQYAAVDIAMCYIVATGTRRSRAVAFALALCVLPAFAILRQLLGLPFRLPHSIESSWSDWQIYTLLAAVAWLVGNSVRQTRAYAERLGAQAAEQAVTAERLRIAREMHDTVAHSIGIIALQAGAAARVAETQPTAAREAMIAVEQAGRETLAGLRRLLGALRESDAGQPRDTAGAAGARAGTTGAGTAAVESAPLRPAAGLADVDRLAAATTAAGVRVEVRWRGERRPLPTDLDLSAFRIIQESVTNVVRHAATTSCTVTVDHREEEIVIEIEDGGPGHASGSGHGTGYGIIGMRERVSLLHGEFSAEARPGGGFRVSARLPLPAAAVDTAGADTAGVDTAGADTAGADTAGAR